ncbi:hypothetical protein DPMN_127528 [Dreissena polymorpha]|uniref:Uncharacterized protein n=1 Tax=Dreissena polymorpha TaxID=45954 RepID=A0A9D4H5E4_DREPO|nr:hypothetical protein DPMN_127528 [Dreissena polymorpha]
MLVQCNLPLSASRSSWRWMTRNLGLSGQQDRATSCQTTSTSGTPVHNTEKYLYTIHRCLNRIRPGPEEHLYTIQKGLNSIRPKTKGRLYETQSSICTQYTGA